jgi:hypothetical protein
MGEAYKHALKTRTLKHGRRCDFVLQMADPDSQVAAEIRPGGDIGQRPRVEWRGSAVGSTCAPE